MHYLAIEPALRPEIHIGKLICGKDMSNVKSLDALGVYLEII